MNRRGVLIVAVLALTGVAASVAWQHYCAPRIAAAEAQQQERAWLAVLPPDSYDNQPLQRPIALPDAELLHSRLQAGYLATLHGRTSAVLLHSRFAGYAGAIDLLIAIDRDGRVIASRVLQQQETPGLGGRIAEQDNTWLQGFNGHGQANTAEGAWALKRDNGQFDQLAGASITSRAVIHAIQDALRYFDQHASDWLGEEKTNE